MFKVKVAKSENHPSNDDDDDDDDDDNNVTVPGKDKLTVTTCS